MEVLVRRKILSVIQDQAQKVMEGTRELSSLYDALSKKDIEKVQVQAEKVKKLEDDVEELRRRLTRELAEIGALILNREDVLHTAYSIEQIAAYLSGIAFRFSQLSPRVLNRRSYSEDLNNLIFMTVEIVHRLNDEARSLTINPASAPNLANEVQLMERQIDDRYRLLTMKILKEVKPVGDLILLKDIIERLENVADACLTAADSITILALGL